MDLWNARDAASANPPRCCIGLGYGDVFAIGPNRAMGDEMNRVSKLGEDIADGGEILLTHSLHAAVCHRPDCDFRLRARDNLGFAYYVAEPRTGGKRT
jgi:class 3 adenylate cyclase